LLTPEEEQVTSTEQFWWRAVSVIYVVSVVLYLLQIFTPLRLTSDGLAYLSLADSANTHGLIATLKQSTFPFPKGYPAFVFMLMKGGIFSSATLVATNLFFFAVGLTFSFRTLITLGFQKPHAAVACLLTLLSFAAVKHVTQGMSDFLFFALAAIACWAMTLSSPYKWLIVLPFVACAIEVRFIGLVLMAPLAATVWPSVRKRPLVLAIASSTAVVLVVAGAWAGRPYLVKNIIILRNVGLGRFLGKNVVAHCLDFGELITNVPFAKLPGWFYVFMLTIGGIAMLLFFAGIATLMKRSMWTSFYMLGFSGLILPWPYTDPRFWLPALPFVLLTIHAGATTVFKHVPKSLVRTYCTVFCALGIAALGYSTWITFSGAQFPYRYGDGLLRATYLAHCSPTPIGVDQRALHLLRRYEWRCEDVH